MVSAPALHMLRVMLELLSWNQVHVIPSLMEILLIVLYVFSLLFLMLLYSVTYSGKFYRI